MEFLTDDELEYTRTFHNGGESQYLIVAVCKLQLKLYCFLLPSAATSTALYRKTFSIYESLVSVILFIWPTKEPRPTALNELPKTAANKVFRLHSRWIMLPLLPKLSLT